MVKTFLMALLGLWLALQPAFARAQITGDYGQLVVTVTDPSGAVVNGATVTPAGLDNATKRASVKSAQTAGSGVAAFDALPLGRYRIRVSLPGFETAQMDLRIQRGPNKQTIALELLRVSEEVNVGDDPVTASVDPRGGFFLTQPMIDALPDDPVAMANFLMGMAGTNVIHVDGFPDGVLPAKSQIKSIHISQDAFAAEYHAAGGRVDVVTKVGEDAMTGSFGFNAGNEWRGANGRVRFQAADPVSSRPHQITPNAAFNTSAIALSPFAASVPASSDRSGNFDFSGTFIPKKSSYAVSVYSDRSFQTPLINVALPSGKSAGVADFHSRSDYDTVSAMVDYALTHDHAVRLRYSLSKDYETSGVGGYNLPERAVSWRDTWQTLRFQESGPLGSHGFINTRFESGWDTASDRSAFEKTTIRVLDGFTAGGAQDSGDFRSNDFNVGSDIDYVRGIHSFRTGFQMDSSRNHSGWLSNYLGTYTFESLADYRAGRPRSFTRAIGDPLVDYWHLQTGVYFQDDIRLRKNLVLSPGIRYEAQLHVQDHANWAPRFGLNWAPGKPGQTAIRVSGGIFYNWMSKSVYEQSVRYDGQHQEEINVANPDPNVAAAAGPANRYLLGQDLLLPRLTRFVVSLNQKIDNKVRLNVGYTRIHASVFRGNNRNAPQGGVRPDPALANVIELLTDARSATNQFNANFNINLAGIAAAPGGAGAVVPSKIPKLFDWRRQTFGIGYNYIRQEDNATGGPFNVSPGGSLTTEWGPSSGSSPHNANISISNSVVRNLTLNLNGNWVVGRAYTLLTGYDTNGDLIFNDRPAGVGRNTLRAASQLTVGGQIRYAITGKIPHPYTVNVQVTASNLMNRRNYTAYSGVMTSPFFLQPTAVFSNAFGPRSISGGVNVSF